MVESSLAWKDIPLVFTPLFQKKLDKTVGKAPSAIDFLKSPLQSLNNLRRLIDEAFSFSEERYSRCGVRYRSKQTGQFMAHADIRQLKEAQSRIILKVGFLISRSRAPRQLTSKIDCLAGLTEIEEGQPSQSEEGQPSQSEEGQPSQSEEGQPSQKRVFQGGKSIFPKPLLQSLENYSERSES